MKNIIITIVVAVIVGAAAFFGGMKYQQSQSGRQISGQFGQFRNRNTNSNPSSSANNQTVRGQVLSVDNSSVSIKMPDGSSKIVLLSDKTTFSQMVESSASAIQNGQQVAAFGTTNTDGSLSATNIQINPQTFAGRGNFGPQ